MATNNYFGFSHGGTQYRAAGYDTAYQAAATPAYYYGHGQTAAAAGYARYEQIAAAAATYAATYTQRTTATRQAQAAAMREEYWARRHFNMPEDEEDRMYWEDRRRYEEEFMDMTRRGNMGIRGRPPFPGAPPAMREEYWARRHFNMPKDEEDRMYWEDRRRYEEEYMEMMRRGNMGMFPRGRPSSPGAPPTVAATPAEYTGTFQPNPNYKASHAQQAVQTTIATQPTTQAKQANTSTTTYVAQQGGANQQKTGWQGYKKGKAPSKPQQLHYCDVCRSSCVGNQTYFEHLLGQKHKKREAATKMAASVAVTNQNRAGNSLHCQLCDVTCTGNDSYAAHIRGAKHQKVVLLHTKLGKPIPPQEPEVEGGSRNGNSKEDEGDDTPEPDIQPVGEDYIEEIKSDDGKVISFNCKLCECRFNDPNAKEMHMKCRRHRLQYKKKVNPDLVVDVEPSLSQRKMQEEKMRKAAMREEYWAHRHFNMPEDEEEYMDMMRRGNMGMFPRGRPPFPGAPPYMQPGMPMARRKESSDDRHVMARHSEICPKEDESQSIQRIVSHTERALKIVSDQLAESTKAKETPAVAATAAKTDSEPEAQTADKATVEQPKEDGRDNQLFSFQQGETSRILNGVTRVGHLAKGLLLRGDTNVELVVLCADKPTLALLRKVVEMLPPALKQVAPENAYTVTINAADAGLIISGDGLTVLVQLTSPVMREQEAASGGLDRDVLTRGKCLQALAALRHTKWFQAKALGLHSCVVIMRILRDLCQRVPTWAPLSSWAMELLAEKVISSIPGQVQLLPGDALRRVMEAVASGLLLPGGPGLGDPCEKDIPDAAAALTAQQREDLTCSAQYAVRLIAYRQIYKLLGMEPLPKQKIYKRNRSARKRRRSGGETADSETDTGKIIKTDGVDAPADAPTSK